MPTSVSRAFWRNPGGRSILIGIVTPVGRVETAEMMSTFLLAGPAPPEAPALWQATHDESLKTGPSPSPPWLRASPLTHSRWNSSLPRRIGSSAGASAAAAIPMPPRTATAPRNIPTRPAFWNRDAESLALMVKSLPRLEAPNLDRRPTRLS